MKKQPFTDQPPVDPALYVRKHGPEALAERLRIKGGYVIQADPLNALEKALRRNLPLLLEGAPGAGKTALALGLRRAFNLPSARVQCMAGLDIEKVLYRWNTSAQDQYVRQRTEAGQDVDEVSTEIWTRRFLKLGPGLAPFDYAARNPFRPLQLIDEIDKLDEEGEDMFLQLLQDGYADVPELVPDTSVGVTEQGGDWPIIILTSNNMRSGVSSPLRDRCYYTYIESATPEEEIYILSASVPGASAALLAQVVKLMRYINSMGGVQDKPALRTSIRLLGTLVDEGVERLTREVIAGNLCAVAKRKNDINEMKSAVPAMMRAVERVNDEIDGWARKAYEKTQDYISKAGAIND